MMKNNLSNKLASMQNSLLDLVRQAQSVAQEQRNAAYEAISKVDDPIKREKLKRALDDAYRRIESGERLDFVTKFAADLKKDLDNADTNES